jgi:anti-sigma factor RsiW
VPEEILIRYVAGHVSAQAAGEVNAHIRDCKKCRELLEEVCVSAQASTEIRREERETNRTSCDGQEAQPEPWPSDPSGVQ